MQAREDMKVDVVGQKACLGVHKKCCVGLIGGVRGCHRKRVQRRLHGCVKGAAWIR